MQLGFSKEQADEIRKNDKNAVVYSYDYDQGDTLDPVYIMELLKITHAEILRLDNELDIVNDNTIVENLLKIEKCTILLDKVPTMFKIIVQNYKYPDKVDLLYKTLNLRQQILKYNVSEQEGQKHFSEMCINQLKQR